MVKVGRVVKVGGLVSGQGRGVSQSGQGREGGQDRDIQNWYNLCVCPELVFNVFLSVQNWYNVFLSVQNWYNVSLCPELA